VVTSTATLMEIQTLVLVVVVVAKEQRVALVVLES
jgi:hypothetical protein